MTGVLLEQVAHMLALLKATMVPGAEMRKQPPPLTSKIRLQERCSREGCGGVTLLLPKIYHATPFFFFPSKEGRKMVLLHWGRNQSVSECLVQFFTTNKAVTSLLSHFYLATAHHSA